MGEMMRGLYGGRYMITLMGAFAVYCGFIYNDLFSLAMDLYGSHWAWLPRNATVGPQQGDEAVLVQGQLNEPSSVYPFGADPSWHVADNELLFFNSMKMKMSVVLGIIQMMFGQCLKARNALFFNEKVDFFFEFIPQIIFSACLFGYMVILIFTKWSINWTERMAAATCSQMYVDSGVCDATQIGQPIECQLNIDAPNKGCDPPNLITTLIGIALSPGTVDMTL
jgi:V-type H+-transporting ATPase subunit a